MVLYYIVLYCIIFSILFYILLNWIELNWIILFTTDEWVNKWIKGRDIRQFTSSCAHIILALMVNRFGLMPAMEGSERPYYASSNSPP